MTTWENRPVEVANLFNPAFCGEIIRLCIGSYEAEKEQGFPYILTFFILPILLYPNTRSTINARRYRFIHVWLQSNPHVRIDFALRTQELLPITQESVTFLLQLRAITMNDDGKLSCTEYTRRRPISQREDPIDDFYSKAIIFGQWLANSGEAENIYVMLGVQP